MQHQPRTSWILAFAVAALAVAPLAMAKDPAVVATPLGAEVAFAADAPADLVMLTVSGPGTEVTERFTRGATPVFSLYDRDGASRPDGTYTWELTQEFQPVNNVVHDPANGRDTATHTERERIDMHGWTVSGSFMIVNGAVVDSSLVEDDPAERQVD